MQTMYPPASVGLQADGTQRIRAHPAVGPGRTHHGKESVLADSLNTLNYFASPPRTTKVEQPDELTNTLYYATGVLPPPRPFSFQTKRLRIDWRALVGVDVEAVVRQVAVAAT